MDRLAPLGLNFGYLFLQIVGFLLLLLALNFILYRPLIGALGKRRERIAEGLNNARKAEEALASAEADRQKILDEARAESQKIISEARSRAEEAANQIKAQAEEDARRVRSQAETDAASERDRLLAEMRDQIVSLSMAAAHHLIGKSLDDKRQKELVSEFFTSLPKGAKGLGDSYMVVTAIPLTAAEKTKFKKDLGTESVTFQTDPTILGGVIVRAGSQQLDGSFASQLAELRASLS